MSSSKTEVIRQTVNEKKERLAATQGLDRQQRVLSYLKNLALLDKVLAADALGMGTPTVFESAMVLTIKPRLDGLAMVNEFLRESGTQAISFTDRHASIALAPIFGMATAGIKRRSTSATAAVTRSRK
jgi:hypothetical protein